MSQDEFNTMLRTAIESRFLTIEANEKMGMYSSDRYVRISLMCEGEEIAYTNFDLPAESAP